MKITLFFYIKNDSFPCVIEKLYLILPTIICVNVYWKSHTNLTHAGKYFRPSKVKITSPTLPK